MNMKETVQVMENNWTKTTTADNTNVVWRKKNQFKFI
jgi:hypothetical protein